MRGRPAGSLQHHRLQKPHRKKPKKRSAQPQPQPFAPANTPAAHWAHSAHDSPAFLAVRILSFLPFIPFFSEPAKLTLCFWISGFVLCDVYTAYQQPVKYNLAVAREVLKHVYTAERLQPPTSLGAVFGTYGTLWGRARSLGYWREVVRSGEYARVGVYALEAYGIFKVRFVFFLRQFFLSGSLSVV